jgi:hypothetical protein
MGSRSRYLIGIDLGTTNTVVSYVDTHEAGPGGAPVMRLLPIPQLVAERETRELASLPSFLYVADAHEVAAGEVRLPWESDARSVVGAFARERGALVPARQVASAKSWLCHGEVDRTAPILPWGADDPAVMCSPVEASSRYLAHIRDGWNHAVSAGGPDDELRFEKQEFVVTVPASFDEEARELTARAVREAGIERFTLLEEPLAAFYAWIVAYHDSIRERLKDGDLVLICDVGGGTTDFSLVRARTLGGEIQFERTAIGDHLLLGGDNVDLALARRMEEKLGNPKLSVRQRNSLRRQCCVAKERLLTDPDLERIPISVLGGGKSIVGGLLNTELTCDDVEETFVEGFLPLTAPGDLPMPNRHAGLRELGLPYATDPAITRHLAEFLTRSFEAERGQAPESIADAGGGPPMLRPDAVLFNGGFFIPEGVRDRVVEAIEGWFNNDGSEPWRLKVLVNEVAESAVAVGAAYYAHVRRGGGVRIGAGAARTYYLGVHSDAREAGARVRAVCVVPRGTEEGTTLRLENLDFTVLTNRPVAFTLYSSTTQHDDHGDVVSLEEGDLHRHAPLATVLRHGQRSRRAELAVRVAARFTEVGTLELWCESREAPHRWLLQFQLGGAAQPGAAENVDGARTLLAEGSADRAVRLIRALFGGPADLIPGESLTPEELVARIEGALGYGKEAWPLGTIRALGDALADVAGGRRKGPRYEARWLNLLGFCLRPGFGADGDAARAARAWEIAAAGVTFLDTVACRLEWEVFLQRVAGGFDARQQHEIYEDHRRLLGIGEKRCARVSPQVELQAWRVLASLERLAAPIRVALGRELLGRVLADPSAKSHLWSLGRLGSRVPLYGPLDCVVPPETASAWIDALLALRPVTLEVGHAVAQIGARTNDLDRDIGEEPRRAAIAKLARAGLPEKTFARLSEVVPARAEASRLFGESLPEGLRLVG